MNTRGKRKMAAESLRKSVNAAFTKRMQERQLAKEAKETQPMSDTLQEEEEDRMIATAICICHKFIRLHDGTCPVHGFVRKQLEDDSGYCPECKGRPHAPWCSLYKPDKEVIEQRMHCGQPMRYDGIENGDIFNGLQLTGTYYCERCCTMQPTYKLVSEHQPAARGGGDAATGGAICKSHGLAVLVTHVNDGEPCSDYLSDQKGPSA